MSFTPKPCSHECEDDLLQEVYMFFLQKKSVNDRFAKLGGYGTVPYGCQSWTVVLVKSSTPSSISSLKKKQSLSLSLCKRNVSYNHSSVWPNVPNFSYLKLQTSPIPDAKTSQDPIILKSSTLSRGFWPLVLWDQRHISTWTN